MNTSVEIQWLAAVAALTLMLWVPYILESFVSRGILTSMGNPGPDDPTPPAWADRARRAHRNAVDNIAVFAPLVLAVYVMELSTPLTALAAKIYFFARLGHYVVYVLGIPVVRTLMFLGGVGATLVFAAALLIA